MSGNYENLTRRGVGTIFRGVSKTYTDAAIQSIPCYGPQVSEQQKSKKVYLPGKETIFPACFIFELELIFSIQTSQREFRVSSLCAISTMILLFLHTT